MLGGATAGPELWEHSCPTQRGRYLGTPWDCELLQSSIAKADFSQFSAEYSIDWWIENLRLNE